MEKASDYWSAMGPLGSPSVNTTLKMETSAWGIPSRSDAYHMSSDVSLFSSSLPVLQHEKLNLLEPDPGLQSVDGELPELDKFCKNADGKNAVDDFDLQEIGSMLPDDEEELLAGIMDDFDLTGLPSQVEEVEDYDVFGTGGGMELDFDPTESLNISMAKTSINGSYLGNGTGYGVPHNVATIFGEHPFGEHPSRTLFVRNINSNVEDSELRSLFEDIFILMMPKQMLKVFNFIEWIHWRSCCSRTWVLRLLQYGDIRTLYSACKHRGFVMISYYDIRAARTAMRALQNKPLRRRKLDIHFSIPKDNPSDKDINQGTLVIFNLDPSVSNDELHQIFGAYGEVKEIRETPHKRHHKFIEFYDVRAAEAALRSLNRIDLAGKRIKLEPSRPGGTRRNLVQQLSQEFEQDEVRSFRHQIGSPITDSPPGTWAQFSRIPDHLQSLSHSPPLGPINPTAGNQSAGLASILSPVPNSTKIAPIGKDQSRISREGNGLPGVNSPHGIAFQQSHTFPEPISGIMPSNSQTTRPFSSLGPLSTGSSRFEALTGHQFLWGSPPPYSEHGQSSTWEAPAVESSFTSDGQARGFLYSDRHGSLLGSSHHHHHHVGSAPSVVPSGRYFNYFPESPEISFMNSVGIGGIGIGRNERNLMMNMVAQPTIGPGVGLSRSMTDNGSPSFRMASTPMFGPLFFGNSPYSCPLPGSVESLVGRGRGRRVENNASQSDMKQQYHLNLEKIVSGEDTRTTLMIKNIPNKYTSKMLLSAIDENHKGNYDFFYLPIDFKNKCNVGYAFVNMMSPSHIVSFYEAFNGKKWEKFNSEKVASLAYARIQGKAALVAHFQNSSLMNEDKRCHPILFRSEGPEAGNQEPFPPSHWNIQAGQADGAFIGDSSESTTKKNLHENGEESPSISLEG
uniref:Protein MEI2-like 2 n=2 Tax=Anthurium amnicola TaxID=1678845 RepID=A0A1D1Y6Q2_9ARAE